MTKEEAKTVFLNRGYIEVEGGIIYDPDKWREACVVISEWLKQESNTAIATGDGAYYKINACEYAISLQAVLDAIGNVPDYGDGMVWEALSHAQRDVALVPPVNPTKTGHWINAKVGKLFPSNDFKCSECGNILDFNGVNCGRGDANYCPNCGAKMIEPQERNGEE